MEPLVVETVCVDEPGENMVERDLGISNREFLQSAGSGGGWWGRNLEDCIEVETVSSSLSELGHLLSVFGFFETGV
jgi:hypothetical protein